MKRRELLAMGAAVLAAPYIARAQMKSQTPVHNGKRVRRRLSTLADDDPFFAAYALAIQRMHEKTETDPLSWIAQAKLHADYCQHDIEFFPWHRAYLVYFERICGALIDDSDFALPYWSWADNNGRLPAPFFANGPLNVLSWNDSGKYVGKIWGNVETTPYRFAKPDFGLSDGVFAGSFTPAAMRAMETARTFQLLTALTDSPHGITHVFVGGSTGIGADANGHFSSGLSPLDPIFWLHHANVDRVWAQSAIPVSNQLPAIADPNKVYTDMFVDEQGRPAKADITSLFDFGSQEYTYDFLVPQLLSFETKSLQEQILAAQTQIRDFAAKTGISLAEKVTEQVIGSTSVQEENVVGAITSFNVKAADIAEVLTTQNVVPLNLPFAKTTVGIEGRRVYARFTGVQPLPASENNALKVFVNCPYLSPATPTTDPHYAGAISFFGCSPEICGERTFVVDITNPLRNGLDSGALAQDIKVQLLAPTGDGTATGAEVARFGGEVELISV